MSHNYSRENPPKVIRNNETITLSEVTFGKTSPQKGQKFWTVGVGISNLDSVIKFLGTDIVCKTLERFVRRVAIDLFTDNDNRDEQGHYIWDDILKGFESLDTGGATLKELSDERDELIDANFALMEDDDYEENEDGTHKNETKWKELNDQIIANNKKLSSIKRSIKAIQEKYAAIAAKRMASKENKAAAPAK